MSDEPKLDMLTAKQCECLELVLRHMTSKKIAIELGISPFTVDQRLDAARQKLGAATRQEAAITYMKLKKIPESLVYQDLALHLEPEMLRFQDGNPSERLIPDPFMLANQSADASSQEQPTDCSRLPSNEAPSGAVEGTTSRQGSVSSGKDTTEREKFGRLLHILCLAIAMLVVMLIAVMASVGMTRIFHGG